MTVQRQFRHFIGGKWQVVGDEGWVPTVSPSDESDVIGYVPTGTNVAADRAAQAARVAFAQWHALPGASRGEHLYRWAEVLASRQDEIGAMIAREVGKPIGEARGEVGRGVAILRYYAGEAVRQIGEVIPALTGDGLQFTLRQPVGPVALITPWNFPLAIPLWKAAPALAYGNTVVLKPAEVASSVAVLLAETAEAAGMPAGTFNLVMGKGSAIGEPLVDHPEIRALSFTGSTAVGMRLAAKATARNIKYQTEMGGKNVGIVMPDADLAQAAALVAGGAMRYAGQKCTATSRVVVCRSVLDAFTVHLRNAIADLPLGPVDSHMAAVGPLISRDARDYVEQMVAAAGGDVLMGGRVPTAHPFDRGFFYEPTVITGVNPESAVAQEEIFGPVLALLPAADINEAIAIANGTRFGLSAALFTRDLNVALQYIRQIDVGMVRVNGDTTGVDPHAPFGGMRHSSSHSREQGRAAIEFFTEMKTVQVNPVKAG